MRPIVFALLTSLMLTFPLAAGADDDDREALERAQRDGELMPLADILASVRKKTGGRVTDIEFEYEDGIPVYEFYWIDPSGRRREMKIDARTGAHHEDEDDD